MEFLAVVTILLALTDLYQLNCLVMVSSSVLYHQRRRLTFLQLIEAYSEAVVGQSWVDASMVE